MKKSLFKPFLLLAVCLCLGSILFATPSLAHASSTTQPITAKPSSCNPGAFNVSFPPGGLTLHPGNAVFAITCSVIPVMLGFQPDGNLVLYIGGQAKWASHTINPQCTFEQNVANAYAAFQADGNLVVYDCFHAAPFASHTVSTNNPMKALTVQSDGNVVIYASDGSAPWSTHTCCY